MFDYLKAKVKGNNVIRIKSSVLNNDSFIGEGSNGKVYRLDNGDCVKIWEKLFIGKDEVNKIYNFSNFNASCAVFPKKLAFVKGEPKGYTMDYINGVYPEDCFDFDYSYFIDKMNLLLNYSSLELAPNHIIIKDTHYGNVMWDKKKELFRFIDVDGWAQRKSISENEVRELNFKKIIEMCAVYVLGTNDTIYFDKAHDIDMKTDFVDLYETIRKELEGQSGKRLKTVHDVREYVKRLR